MEVENQIHYIKLKNSKIETIKLGELFKNFNESSIKQIIRFNSNVFDLLNKNLNNGETINLFNKINPNVNYLLIENFKDNPEENNKALITKIQPKIISGQVLPIIIESSLKIVDILEMNDLYIENIINNKLYENSIPKAKTFKEFKNWFIKEFEQGRITEIEFEQFTKMFYRQIILDK